MLIVPPINHHEGQKYFVMVIALNVCVSIVRQKGRLEVMSEHSIPQHVAGNLKLSNRYLIKLSLGSIEKHNISFEKSVCYIYTCIGFDFDTILFRESVRMKISGKILWLTIVTQAVTFS